jgi:flagellar basal body-associated protein FliL
MAEEETQPQDEEVVDETPTGEDVKPSKKKGFFKRLLTLKGLAILVVLSIVVHAAVFACTRTGKGSSSESGGAEIPLGEFRFEANRAETGSITSAWFSLHIVLLDPVDTEARKKLESRGFRVQQDIEELLRQAHGGDFDDPNLGELKRQLQEQVNETLGMRAIADVIITGLELTPREEGTAPASSTAETVPWQDEPST